MLISPVFQTFATRNEKHSRLFDVFLASLRSTRAFNIDNDCSYTSRLVQQIEFAAIK